VDPRPALVAALAPHHGLLGTTFLGFQAYEFTAFVHEGLTIKTNLFGSSFFTLTGFHGAHVTVGVLWLVTLLWIDRKRGLAGPADELAWTSPRSTGTSSTWSGSRSSRSSTSSSKAQRCHTTPSSRHAHPDGWTYLQDRVILFVITVAEVWAYYIPSLVASSLFNPSAHRMSAAKFAIVVLFYMHLKYDHKLFRALFTGPLIVAMRHHHRAAVPLPSAAHLTGGSGMRDAGEGDANAGVGPGGTPAHPRPVIPRGCPSVLRPPPSATAPPDVLPVLFLHPNVDLSQGGFTVHWSTVIGLAALWALYLWRAAVARAAGSRGAAGRGAAHALRGRPPADVPGPQRAGARHQRLLPVQRTHGAAPRAHHRRAAPPPARHPGLDAPAGPAARGVATLARAVTGPRAAFAIFNLVLGAGTSRPSTTRRCTTTRCTSCST
jgi:hypothetical protein